MINRYFKGILGKGEIDFKKQSSQVSTNKVKIMGLLLSQNVADDWKDTSVFRCSYNKPWQNTKISRVSNSAI